jgi:hypothetical protein
MPTKPAAAGDPARAARVARAAKARGKPEASCDVAAAPPCGALRRAAARAPEARMVRRSPRLPPGNGASARPARRRAGTCWRGPHPAKLSIQPVTAARDSESVPGDHSHRHWACVILCQSMTGTVTVTPARPGHSARSGGTGRAFAGRRPPPACPRSRISFGKAKPGPPAIPSLSFVAGPCRPSPDADSETAAVTVTVVPPPSQ